MIGRYDDLLLESLASHRSFRSVLFEAGLSCSKVKTALNLKPRILARLTRQGRITSMNATETQEIITKRRTAALRALQSLGEAPAITKTERDTERHSISVLAALGRIAVSDSDDSSPRRLIDLISMDELLSDDDPEPSTVPALLDGREA